MRNVVPLPSASIDIDKAAGLLDDAVDRGQAKAGAFADVLGGEERLEDLADDRRRNAGAGVGDFDQHVVRRRHALGVIALAFARGHIGGAHVQPAAVRHGVARIDREIDDHLLELRDVDLDRPQVAAVHDLEGDLLADQPPQQHVEIAQHLAEIEHLRAQRLLARECQQMPHQARRPVGVLLDLHDVLERRIGRLVRIEQEIGRHHDGGQHVVEIVRDAAGKLADQFHLLLLGKLVLQRALRRGLQRIDDGRFLVALVLLDRGDVEAAEALVRSPASAASTGAMSPLPSAACRSRHRAPAGRARRRWCGSSDRALVAALPRAPGTAARTAHWCATTPPCLSTVAIAIGV